MAPDLAQNGAAKDLRWMVPEDFAEQCGWTYIPVQKLVRGLVLVQIFLTGHCFCWQITGAAESLVRAAVREGVWLSMADLKLVSDRLGVAAPAPGSGSGKNGAVCKVDRARALVNHLFPPALTSAQERQRMVAALVWKTRFKQLGDQEKSLLEWVAEMDEENREAPEFQRVIKLAKQKIKTQEEARIQSETRKLVEQEVVRQQADEAERLARAEADAKAAAAASSRTPAEPSAPSSGHSRKSSESPPDLRTKFLTQDMIDKKISLTRDAGAYGYRAFYPSALLCKWFVEAR